MKLQELHESAVTKAQIISALKQLNKFKVDYVVVGGAGICLHANISCKDVDVYAGYWPYEEMEESGIDLHDWKMTDGAPRGATIKGVDIDLIYSGDVPELDKGLGNAKTVKVSGITTLSLQDLIFLTSNRKRVEKLEEIISALKLPMEWIKTLHPSVRKDYAVAWDTLYDVPVEQSSRWRDEGYF